MKAQDLPFTQLLQGAKQFIIPIFQRTYSWDTAQCEQLWNDIIRVGRDPNLNSHFLGSAVYIPEQDTSAAISRWLVIDGQQRITTITLLLLSFMRRLQADGAEGPVSAGEIEDYYLRNRYGRGDLSYKMLLTKSDKSTLIALLDGKELPESASQRVLSNYKFFCDKMSAADLSVVYEGIQRLMIVDVRLQQGLDNPQMIFESMNSTGKALTQADLIRNYVLMGLAHDLQTKLYQEYWHPMEFGFGADSYNTNFDEFVRFFLVIHTGNHRIRKDEVYQEFKSYSRSRDVEELLQSLKEFSRYYCNIALGKEKEQTLAESFKDIRELKADVAYPLLMELYHDHKCSQLSVEEFKEIILLIESYVFRRVVCDIPTNSLRQTFATFTKKVKKDRYVESVKARFLMLKSYRRFPRDDEFKERLMNRNLYSFNRRSYWLRRFENFERKERIAVQDYTIEHIMPQNESLGVEWQSSLGPEWQKVQTQYLHTLGNLTLTGYNSEYSDKPFEEKRDMKGGFKYSPLKLNQGLAECDAWNEGEIRKRANRLAADALSIWCMPKLPAEILEIYSSEVQPNTGYSVNDHPNLGSGEMRELFDLLRVEVMALDECVREEYLKLYVAYKAETNFLDVVPQVKRLRLSLNIDFAAIDDPRGMAKDVSKVGRWGNGDVEVGLSHKEDIPYVLGLIRQALENQFGDEPEVR